MIEDGIPGGPALRHGRRPRDLLALAATGCIVLVLIGAPGLARWGAQLPEGRVANGLVDLTATWSRTTQRLGLTAFHAELRAALRRLEAVRFAEADDDD
jgi:phage tail protein X